MCIYVDILIITNIYADFFLLKATAKLTHSVLGNGKCVLAAMAGSLFSLVILLPELGAAGLLIIKILSAGIMVFIAFHGKPPSELYRTGLVFFFVCFIFAGAEYAFSLTFGGERVVWHNSVLYVNISLLTLVISTAAAYAVLCIFRRFLDRSSLFDGDYSLIIITPEKKLTVKAICDSGNNLTDFFSGRPVIVCPRKYAAEIFERETLDKLLKCAVTIGGESAPPDVKGFRFIPCSTVNSDGLIPVFLPSCSYIKNNESGKTKAVDAYIGIADREIEYAVFNPKIIS